MTNHPSDTLLDRCTDLRTALAEFADLEPRYWELRQAQHHHEHAPRGRRRQHPDRSAEVDAISRERAELIRTIRAMAEGLLPDLERLGADTSPILRFLDDPRPDHLPACWAVFSRAGLRLDAEVSGNWMDAAPADLQEALKMYGRRWSAWRDDGIKGGWLKQITSKRYRVDLTALQPIERRQIADAIDAREKGKANATR